MREILALHRPAIIAALTVGDAAGAGAIGADVFRRTMAALDIGLVRGGAASSRVPGSHRTLRTPSRTPCALGPLQIGKAP